MVQQPLGHVCKAYKWPAAVKKFSGVHPKHLYISAPKDMQRTLKSCIVRLTSKLWTIIYILQRINNVFYVQQRHTLLL